MSQDNGIHPTNNPLPSQVAVDYADYQTTIGDPPICGRCGLPMFSGDKSMDDVNICPSCYKAGNVTLEPGWKTKPSDLELRIRKEVMGKISDLICLLDDCEERVDIGEISGCPWAAARFDTAVDVQNLLKLLWGE